jgi:hypothetical protein
VSPVNAGNDAINSLTSGTGVFALAPGQAAWFFATSATQWYTKFSAGQTPGTASAYLPAVLGANKNLDVLVVADGGLSLGSGAGTAIGATAAEINSACDISARTQELTATGSVNAGTMSLELNHASVIIAATIANSNTHQGLFVVKDTSATGTANHTLTLTSGTFDGTHNVATFNARDDMLVVHFDSAGRGNIVVNVGSVALS